jgi:hypothetical protein
MDILITLPIETLCRILSYLDDKNLCKILDTCRYLHNFKNDKLMWSRFYEPWLLNVLVKREYKLYAPSKYSYLHNEETRITKCIYKGRAIVTKRQITHPYSTCIHPDMILDTGSYFHTSRSSVKYNGIKIKLSHNAYEIFIDMITGEYNVMMVYNFKTKSEEFSYIRTKNPIKIDRDQHGFLMYEPDSIMDEIQPHWYCYIHEGLLRILKNISNET